MATILKAKHKLKNHGTDNRHYQLYSGKYIKSQYLLSYPDKRIKKSWLFGTETPTETTPTQKSQIVLCRKVTKDLYKTIYFSFINFYLRNFTIKTSFERQS